MRSILTLGGLLALIAAQPAYGYMTPTEVFPDLEVPEVQATSEASSSESSEPAMMEQSGVPVFYRAGEKVEHKAAPTPPPAKQQNIFEEPAPAELPQEEVMEPEEESSEQMEESASSEEPAEQAPEEETEPKPAARRQPWYVNLLSQMKYLIGAVGIALAGGFYFLINKKHAAMPQSDVPEAPKQQMVEESSNRLQHALEVMGEEKKDEPSQENA